MSTFILNNLGVFPTWFQSMALAVWGAVLLATPICILIKMLQNSAVKSFARAVPEILKKIGKFLKKQADDPIKYPRIIRFLDYVSMAQSYVFAALLTFYFTLIVILWVFNRGHLTVIQNISAVVFTFICAYLAAVLKAQGGRELVKIRGRNRA